MAAPRTILVQDANFGAVNRTYLQVAPTRSGAPVVLTFHGQNGSFYDWAINHTYFLNQCGEHGWACVALQGYGAPWMGQPDGADGKSGWNVGTNGDDSTCLPDTNNTACKDSCRRLGQCSSCSWSSCYDDVAFVDAVLASLAREYNVDNTRRFAIGESNGAMMVHYLAARRPGLFRAIVPFFGTPLLGYLAGPSMELILQRTAYARTSLLALHDVNDTIIPWQGGRSTDGWIYEPLDKVVRSWAAAHGCTADAPTPVPVPGGGPTPTGLVCHEWCASGDGASIIDEGALSAEGGGYDGVGDEADDDAPLEEARDTTSSLEEEDEGYTYDGAADRGVRVRGVPFERRAWRRASSGRVVRCMYPGVHGDFPTQPAADELVWNFFAAF